MYITVFEDVGVDTGLLGGSALNERYVYALISRRSTQRAGTRYHTRGVDSAGYAANFVETEQILLIRDLCYAFVQVPTYSYLYTLLSSLRYSS